MKLGRTTLQFGVSLVIIASLTGSVAFAATDTKKTSTDKDKTTTSQKVTAGGGSVESYAADSVLQNGTIVQLVGKSANQVGVATQKDIGHMYGVTVDPHKLSITISDSSLKNETSVATSGTYDTLVSTEGGTIVAGDYVTISAINGVAMKADSTQATVFGRAATGFDGKSDSIGNVALKDTTGQANKQVALGLIPVSIDIRRNPNEKSTKAEVPKLLQRIGQAVAEKPVGPLRIYLSVAITGASIIGALTILYSGVRSSLFSIGRNPLSKKSIFRGLLEIVLTSIIILIIGLFAVYLLLKL